MSIKTHLSGMPYFFIYCMLRHILHSPLIMLSVQTPRY